MKGLSHIKKTFGAKNALLIAIIAGIMLTGLMMLAHADGNGIIRNDFNLVYSLSVNIVIIFAVLVFSFFIIRSAIPTVTKYIVGLAGALLIAVCFSFLSGFIHRLIYDELLPGMSDINILRDILVAVVAVLIALLLYDLSSHLQSSIEKEQMQNENLLVRYEALENQLDPHFLFNSLNTLSALIGNDDNRAQQYLQQLASTYRYIMQGKRLVSLLEELRFVSSYCQMLQIRYGDNLKFEHNIDHKYLNYQILPISVQLLIENALKHNVVSDRYPLTVTVETTPNDTIRVANAMRAKKEDNSNSGLGLPNLTKRYQLLCNKDILISQQNNIFSVELPLLPPPTSPPQ